MAILMNYTIQCRDATTGQVGCFLFDTAYWQKTGEFIALSPVFANLVEFYANTHPDQRKAIYLERIA